jgi:hypothetical protein
LRTHAIPRGNGPSSALRAPSPRGEKGTGDRGKVHAGRTHLAENVALNAADSTSSSLLRRALAREPDAWERLVSLYSPLVHHWCRQAGIAQHEIADVMQEVFAAVVREEMGELIA